MRSRIVDLHYFSGTGNTYSVACAMAETLAHTGIETHVIPIAPGAPIRVAPGRALGLAFPVAYQSTYPFLCTPFARCLTDRAQKRSWWTRWQDSGALVGRLKALMLSKGYQPIGAREIQMPLNFWLLDAEKMRHGKVIEKGLAQARRYAHDLAEGKTRWGRIPVLADSADAIYLSYRWTIFTRMNQRACRIRNDAERCVVRALRQELPSEGISRCRRTQVVSSVRFLASDASSASSAWRNALSRPTTLR